MIKVKLCGFTSEEDVKAACKLGPDLIGTIIDVKGSFRSLDVDRARRVLAAVERGIDRVAVTRLKELENGLRIIRGLKPDFIQVYTNLPASELGKLKSSADVGLIASVLIPRGVKEISPILDRAIELSEVADYVLVDTKGPTGGGTGLVHDWEISAKIRARIGKPMFLAGGLNPSNVREAIKTIRPYGVDVASGIESRPGKKDFELMQRFIESARRA